MGSPSLSLSLSLTLLYRGSEEESHGPILDVDNVPKYLIYRLPVFIDFGQQVANNIMAQVQQVKFLKKGFYEGLHASSNSLMLFKQKKCFNRVVQYIGSGRPMTICLADNQSGSLLFKLCQLYSADNKRNKSHSYVSIGNKLPKLWHCQVGLYMLVNLVVRWGMSLERRTVRLPRNRKDGLPLCFIQLSQLTSLLSEKSDPAGREGVEELLRLRGELAEKDGQ